MLKYSNLSNLNNVNAVETRDHFKNGASLKSQMSRGITSCLLLFIVFFSSCGNGEWEPVFSSEIMDIISFNPEGGTVNVKIERDIAFTVETVPEWITAEKTGNTGKQIFHLTASKNELNEKRAGYVTCKGESSKESIIITIPVIQDKKEVNL